ncbi:MAG: TonB-dependent receptor [Deltaproteobacteria bacterium]|nr:TonB-dependent receptor [Deltaproteobacteria bacterium]
MPSFLENDTQSHRVNQRWPRVLQVLALACASLASATASAQPPNPETPASPAPTNITPPVLLTKPMVSYPKGAHGDGRVVLAITVNADGTVRTVRVMGGEEPFASAAAGAARTWQFDAASRDGQPVAAVIRFEVKFKAPAAEAQDGVTPQPAIGAQPAAGQHAPKQGEPSANPPITVYVRGTRAPAVTSMTRAEVRQLPGAFGDPFRAVEAMPGVTPVASGLPYFYVRGAPPGNVGYFLDGIRVPYLYHIGLGPSVVHPGLMERVDLYPGGYPARFGGLAGAIVSGETAEPRPELHGEGNLRLFDVGALAETGFANGRGTALVGGRYSYMAAMLSLVDPSIVLDYRDYQARASYDITPKDRVSIFSFGAYDLYGERLADRLKILFGSEFYRLDVRYDHAFSRASTLRWAVTLGYDQTRVGEQRNGRDRSIGTRLLIHHPLDDNMTVRAGADLAVDAFGASSLAYDDPQDPETRKLNALFPKRTDTALGAWADLVWNLSPAVEVTPGVRAMLFTSGASSALAIDPRIVARFKITDKVRIIHAYGIAHQPPSFVAPIPGLAPGTLKNGLQSAFQTSAGVETDLPQEVTASATLFHNAFFNMTDTLGSTTGEYDLASDRRSQGSAAGLELLVRRRLTKKLGGFLSYTLARSVRTLGRETFPSAYDRTHVLNAAVAYDFGRGWRAGTRLVFYSGNPVASPSHGLIVPPRSGNPKRNPAFYRLDLRLEKRWIPWKRGWLSLVFELMNATLSRESIMSPEGDVSTIGPVTIPSVGLEGGY